ncbi:hypothetical protein RZS08_41415, partial [Arthrospira platensis SPKY1]|nr:hypothetical protein [Arthrospira platensis SPKY1]
EATFEGNNPAILEQNGEIQVLTDQFLYTFQAAGRQFVKTAPAKPFTKAEDLLPGVYQPLPLHADYAFFPVHNGFALDYLPYTGDEAEEMPPLIIRNIEAFNNEQ